MKINKSISDRDYMSLVKLFESEDKKVTDKIVSSKFKSFVCEGEQYIFVDDVNDIKSIVKSMINEVVDTDAKEYIQHHGKKPAGAGKWIFGIGSRKREDWFSFDGKFTDAKNAALEKAKEKGKSKIYVMEQFDFKDIDLSYKTEKQSPNHYRISVISEGKEKYATTTYTEATAEKLGVRWIVEDLNTKDIFQEKMNKTQVNKREKIVHGMKKKISDFKKRYGDKYKQVMYATANKMANEEVSDSDPNIGRKWKEGKNNFEVIKKEAGKYIVYKNGNSKEPLLLVGHELNRRLNWKNNLAGALTKINSIQDSDTEEIKIPKKGEYFF